MPLYDYPSTGVDNDTISIGQCVVYAQYYQYGSVSGVTPSASIGRIKDASLEITTEFVDVETGHPSILDERFPVRQKVQLKLTGREHDRDKYFWATAEGASQGTEGWGFGGNQTSKKLNIMIQKTFPDGDVEYFDCWKCVSNGTMTRNFVLAGENLIEYTFDLMREDVSWVGTSLVTESGLKDMRLFRRRKVNAV